MVDLRQAQHFQPLVAMGDEMVGNVHPSKIYGAMAVGRPMLALGRRRSHVSESVREFDVGFYVEHGDVDGVERRLRALVNLALAGLSAMGRRAQSAVNAQYTRARLCGRFCDVLENGLRFDS